MRLSREGIRTLGCNCFVTFALNGRYELEVLPTYRFLQERASSLFSTLKHSLDASIPRGSLRSQLPIEKQQNSDYSSHLKRRSDRNAQRVSTSPLSTSRSRPLLTILYSWLCSPSQSSTPIIQRRDRFHSPLADLRQQRSFVSERKNSPESAKIILLTFFGFVLSFQVVFACVLPLRESDHCRKYIHRVTCYWAPKRQGVYHGTAKKTFYRYVRGHRWSVIERYQYVAK